MPSDSRLIKIADDAAELPENLLLAQSRGEVLFLAGAGVSRGAPACLPDFKTLARQLYEELDASVCPYLDDKSLPPDDLTPPQCAEVDRYHGGDFDVALGLLERRLDGPEATETSRVRKAVQQHLSAKTPTRLHRALSRLADRGNATAILTTNFDRLFERCTHRKNHPVPTYGLGGMPRPSIRADFSGIFHIHGVLPVRTDTSTDLVLTDRDFGEYYFRRRFIPDFLYDASRIYQLVLIGYSADDPPMQYLLNAIAADANRFHDIKRPYILVPDNSATRLSDLKGRGLTPITYSDDNNHIELTTTMERWAAMSTKQGAKRVLIPVLRRTRHRPVSASIPSDVHLISHLVKRGSPDDRRRLASAAGRMSHPSWLSQMLVTATECHPVDKDSRDKANYEITCAFLKSRLTDSDAVHWAATFDRHFDPGDLSIIRRAIGELLDRNEIPDPWASAWRWIQDSWSARQRHNAFDAHRAADRFRAGDRSANLVDAIARLVELRLFAEPAWPQIGRRKPKTVTDLLSIQFGEVDFVRRDNLDFAEIDDADFLLTLCHELDRQLSRAVGIARRLYGEQGWKASSKSLLLGLESGPMIGDLDSDPDAVGFGIGPLLQMLYSALRRTAELDAELASIVPKRWQHERSFVHRRLWAAVAVDEDIVAGEDVGDFLMAISQNEFWDFEGLPEICALRAQRFRDLSERQQMLVAAKLRQGPPQFRWLRHLDAKRFTDYRNRRTLREFQAICDSGVTLATEDADLVASFEHIRPYPDPRDPPPGSTPRVYWGTEPDLKFDSISESDLPDALEAALAAERSGRHGAGYGTAGGWVKIAKNWAKIIGGLETRPRGGADYRHLWDCFAVAHDPGPSDGPIEPERWVQGARVLALLDKRPLESVGHDISGISWWLSHWKTLATSTASGVLTTLKFWPLALRDTERSLLSRRLEWIKIDRRRKRYWSTEHVEISALNTSAGRIAGVLAQALLKATTDASVANASVISAQIRERLVSAPGLGGMIAKYHLGLRLLHLWQDDREWTEENIIAPMLNGDDEVLTLWMAFVRASSSTAVKELVEALGEGMVQKTIESRLDSRTRMALAVLLVRYFLYARWEGWEEMDLVNETCQSLRQSETDVLADVAYRALLGFLDHGPAPETPASEAEVRAERFERAVKSVLKDVWPMERTPDRPGLAKAMAQIPAASGAAFADGVDAVRRFLCPFKVYTVRDYGFDARSAALSEVVKTERDAEALLELIDKTVGEGEEARMPFDGDKALARIREVSPRLEKTPAFRRLKTLQKRSIWE